MAVEPHTTAVYGPMKSGKTDKLIDVLTQASRPVTMVYYCSVDTRTKAGTIRSRTGKWMNATPVGNISHVVAAIKNKLAEGIRPTDIMVGVDECQFLPNEGWATVAEVHPSVKWVFAGLDKDALGRPFGTWTGAIIPLVEKIHLAADCDFCGGNGKAYETVHNGGGFSQAKGGILVGDQEYSPVCDNCLDTDKVKQLR